MTAGMTAVEIAVTFAIVGSLTAVAVPAFVRELRSSKMVEPIDGVTQIAEGATAYAKGKDVAHAYPPSAPLTPPTPPRGERAVDPPGAWDSPTWTALGFRAAPDGVAHAFAFGFDSTLASGNGNANGDAGAPVSTFVAHAHGDLDGDGTTSTFEVRGHDSAESGPVIDPGLFVDREVE